MSDRTEPQVPSDEPIARLSAADPTANLPDPDLIRMRERVLGETGGTVVPLRRRPAYLVGAVAAGVALLAGATMAGVAIGRSSAPAPVAAPQAETPSGDTMAVVGANPGADAASGPAGMAAPGAPGVAGPAAPGTADAALSSDMRVGYFSTDLIAGPGLPDDAGTATGYRVSSDSVDAEALARAVAEVFGVPGKVQSEEGSWRVGDLEGPSVWVYDDALVSWSYSDPTQDPWTCAAVIEPTPEEGDPGVAEPCPPAEPPMSERDARREAERILQTLGVSEQSVDGIGVEWETSSDDYVTTVMAWQTIDGDRTQLMWSFTFGAQGPVWANGFGAGLEPVPGYPVVGARTAVERSSDPRWAAFGPVPLDGVVMPLADVAARDEAATTTTASNPSSIQIWWDPATVTAAEPTLAQYWQPDGSMMILPAYRLSTADDRGTWAVISVAESAVSFTTP